MKCNNCNAVQATPLLSCPDTAVCGSPFSPGNWTWNKKAPTAVYADKVFSAHRAEGSSLFYQLNTAENPDTFLSVYELTPCSSDGCCPSNVLSEDAVFEIAKTYVQLDCFSVRETAGQTPAIAADNVTVNGQSVCSVQTENGLYKADISCILNDLINPVCTGQGLPSKAFLLLQDIGNLEFRIRLGFEGVVRSCGVLYRFKAYIAGNTPIALPADLTASFAVAEVNIPCIENGSVPFITFRFDGRAEVINPTLSVTASADAGICDGVKVNVTAMLALIPRVTVEVIRNTLMLVDAAELSDGSACGLDGFNLFSVSGCCPSSSSQRSGGAVCGGCGCNGLSGGNGGKRLP